MADLSHLTNELESLRIAQKEKKKWEDVEAAMIERIEEALGDDEVGTIDGHVVVTWKTSKPGEMFDTKRMKAVLPPEIWQEFVGQKKPGRPFKVVE